MCRGSNHGETSLGAIDELIHSLQKFTFDTDAGTDRSACFWTGTEGPGPPGVAG